MRALKWNMKSSQSEWVPLASPYRTEARGDLKPHSACEEAHSPWASHLNQSLGLDVLIFPALSIGSCAWHLREKKAAVSQKPSWKLSTINKNLPSPESIINCPGPARHLPCTHMLRQPLLHEWRNSGNQHVSSPMNLRGWIRKQDVHWLKKGGGFLANKVLSGC